MAFVNGPYLAMAILCEKALQEQDGVMSVIRVVDRVLHTVAGPSAPESMPPLPINLVAVVSFKSGEARGRYAVKLRPETPSGLKKQEISLPVLFEGGEDRGVNVIVNISLQVQEEGLYWFDVLLDDVVVTRIPLRVVYHRFSLGGAAPPSQ